jgi:hypothetical protein
VTTAYQSFSRSLPDLELGEAKHYTISALGQSTAKTDPPKMWQPDPTPYAQIADDILKKLVPSLQNPLPAVERPFSMWTEVDVFRATALHVTHPINLALNAKYQKTIYCFSEIVKEGARCDITWKYKIGEDFDTIAVLALKRRGVLGWNGFECAKSDAANRETKVRDAYDNMEDARHTVATTFRENALWLSRQAAAYAIQQKTQFVGLFDWDSMFLFRFGELKLDEQIVGDSAYGTWVEDKAPTYFRKTLFGFLVAACEAKIKP